MSTFGKVLLGLGAVAALAACAVGGVVVAVGVLDDDPDTTVTVAAPATLGGKPRVGVSTDGQSTLGKDDNDPDTVQGVYGNVATQDLTVVSAIASTDGSTQDRFDALVKEAQSEFKAKSLTTTEPGALGGLSSCADGFFNTAPAGLCLWADEGSVGLVLRVNQDARATAAEFAGLRAEIETKRALEDN